MCAEPQPVVEVETAIPAVAGDSGDPRPEVESPDLDAVRDRQAVAVDQYPVGTLDRWLAARERATRQPCDCGRHR